MNLFIVFAGYPLFNHIFLAVQHLDGRSGQFRRAGDIRLAHADHGLRVFHQDHVVARLILGLGSGGRHLACLVNREGNIRRNRVAFRCHGLAQRVFLAGLQAFDEMDLFTVFSGYPLFNHCALAVDHLDLRAVQFFAVCNVRLAHADHGLRVFHQDHFVAVCIRGCGAGGRYRACLINREGNIRRNRVAFRCHGLAQRIFLIGLQAFDDMDLFTVFSGYPRFNNCALAVDHLDRRALQFIAVRDIRLADPDFGQRVIDQDTAACNLRSAGRHIAMRVNCKLRIRGNRIAVGRHGLAQRVFHAHQQPFDHMRLRSGCPSVHTDQLVFRVRVHSVRICLFFRRSLPQDLDLCAFQLVASGYALLAHSHFGRRVLDHDMAVGNGRFAGRHVAVFVNREGRVRRNRVAVGRHGLAQRVYLARLQAFDHIRFRARCPIIHQDQLVVLVLILRVRIRLFFRRGLPQNLDMRARQFRSVRNFLLAHGHLGLLILYQDHVVSGFILGRVGESRHFALLIHGEGDVRRYRVACRRHGLAQDVLLTDYQPLNGMRRRCGIPLCKDAAIAVDYLDMCAFQFRTARNLLLGNLRADIDMIIRNRFVRRIIRHSSIHVAHAVIGHLDGHLHRFGYGPFIAESGCFCNCVVIGLVPVRVGPGNRPECSICCAVQGYGIAVSFRHWSVVGACQRKCNAFPGRPGVAGCQRFGDFQRCAAGRDIFVCESHIIGFIGHRHRLQLAVVIDVHLHLDLEALCRISMAHAAGQCVRLFRHRVLMFAHLALVIFNFPECDQSGRSVLRAVLGAGHNLIPVFVRHHKGELSGLHVASGQGLRTGQQESRFILVLVGKGNGLGILHYLGLQFALIVHVYLHPHREVLRARVGHILRQRRVFGNRIDMLADIRLGECDGGECNLPFGVFVGSLVRAGCLLDSVLFCRKAELPGFHVASGQRLRAFQGEHIIVPVFIREGDVRSAAHQFRLQFAVFVYFNFHDNCVFFCCAGLRHMVLGRLGFLHRVRMCSDIILVVCDLRESDRRGVSGNRAVMVRAGNKLVLPFPDLEGELSGRHLPAIQGLGGIQCDLRRVSVRVRESDRLGFFFHHFRLQVAVFAHKHLHLHGKARLPGLPHIIRQRTGFGYHIDVLADILFGICDLIKSNRSGSSLGRIRGIPAGRDLAAVFLHREFEFPGCHVPPGQRLRAFQRQNRCVRIRVRKRHRVRAGPDLRLQLAVILIHIHINRHFEAFGARGYMGLARPGFGNRIRMLAGIILVVFDCRESDRSGFAGFRSVVGSGYNFIIPFHHHEAELSGFHLPAGQRLRAFQRDFGRIGILVRERDLLGVAFNDLCLEFSVFIHVYVDLHREAGFSGLLHVGREFVVFGILSVLGHRIDMLADMRLVVFDLRKRDLSIRVILTGCDRITAFRHGKVELFRFHFPPGQRFGAFQRDCGRIGKHIRKGNGFRACRHNLRFQFVLVSRIRTHFHRYSEAPLVPLNVVFARISLGNGVYMGTDICLGILDCRKDNLSGFSGFRPDVFTGRDWFSFAFFRHNEAELIGPHFPADQCLRAFQRDFRLTGICVRKGDFLGFFFNQLCLQLAVFFVHIYVHLQGETVGPGLRNIEQGRGILSHRIDMLADSILVVFDCIELNLPGHTVQGCQVVSDCHNLGIRGSLMLGHREMEFIFIHIPAGQRLGAFQGESRRGGKRVRECHGL